jgi:hypothetical protein
VVNNDDLQLLGDFRGTVPSPDAATAERIYRFATATRPARRRRFWVHVPGRRRLAIAVAALSLAGALVVGLTLRVAGPESAYAAAKKAIAASSAGAVDSGTMTMLRTAADGSTVTVFTVRWNGDDIAIGSGTDGGLVPGFDQLVLVAGGVYLQRSDGSWLHFVSKADPEPPFYAGAVQAARDLAAGSRAAQIIASTYGLQKTVQTDGSTVYSGTIPPRNPAEGGPSNDAATQLMLPGFGPGGEFRMVVGSDGLVRQMSETISPPLPGAWSIEYSQLGGTAPITPPAAYTEGTAGDLPAPPAEGVHQTEPGQDPASAPVPTETVP